MKRILLSFLQIGLLSFVCQSLSAHDFEVGGVYYNFLSKTKTVAVTFKGDKYDSYGNEYSGNVVIPESVTYSGTTYSVTTIGGYAFYGCTGLTNIEIPNSVTRIGSSAFSGCTGKLSIHCNIGNADDSNYGWFSGSRFNEVKIGEEVSCIGDYAFYYCTDLTSIEIPNSVTSIGYSAFDSCIVLTNIVIPNSVTSIGGSAFQNCTGLTSIVIPSSVTSIGGSAFQNCTGLTSIEIPNSVTSIGSSAFRGCNGLTSINIPSSVTSIGNWAFYGCTGLTSINIPSSVTSIRNYAFEDCTGLTSIVIPSSVTSIGYEAFRGCTGLTSIYIPNSVTSIDDETFCGCTSLTSIEIPNSVTSIGSFAFSGCTGLTSIEIPNSVTSIGSSAFSGCTGLTSIEIPNSVTSIGDFTFSGCTGLTSIEIPNSVTSIGSSAFRGCTGLTSINIPNSVTSIGNWAFSGCTGLTSINIPSSVTSIRNYAFEDCTGLTSIVIPSSVTSIGYRAFEGCNNLKKVYNCSALTLTPGSSSYGYVAYYAISVYNNCRLDGDYVITYVNDNPYVCGYLGQDTELTLPAMYGIGDYAFYDCKDLINVSIPNGVTSIGKAAFSGCTGLASIEIPNSVTSIGDGAFSGCSNLQYNKYDNALYLGNLENPFVVLMKTQDKNVDACVIADNCKFIYNDAFNGCTGLSDIIIPENVTSIGVDAFKNCNNLKKVYNCSSLTLTPGSSSYGYVAYYATSVYNNCRLDGDYVFTDVDEKPYVCGYVGQETELTLPATYGISDYAFNDYKDLTKITIPNGVKSIGENAFKNCTVLTSIEIPNSVTSIGDGAFSGCSNLQYNKYDNALYLGNLDNPFLVLMKAQNKNVDACAIADNCKFIYNDAFNGCTGLSDIIIPENVTSIGVDAFKNCNNLKKVYNNSALTLTPGSSSYGYVAYYAISVYNNCRLDGDYVITYVNDNPYVCGYLGQDTELTLPATDGVGDYAFYDCKDLINVSIPNGVTSIGKYAFAGCSGLTSIEIPNSVTSIGNNAFSGCTGLTSIEIPNSVTSIGRYAFKDCTGTISINCDIEDAENSNEGWFYGSKFSEVILGETVNKVGKYAFYGSTSIKSLTIGGNVNRIDYYAFDNCTGLKSIYSNAVNPPACRDNAFHGDTKWDCSLYVPLESIEAYKAATAWRDFLTIKENPYYSSLESIATMDKNDAPLYDLQGTQVVAPRSNGLYIRDGKKIILK